MEDHGACVCKLVLGVMVMMIGNGTEGQNSMKTLSIQNCSHMKLQTHHRNIHLALQGWVQGRTAKYGVVDLRRGSANPTPMGTN